MSTPTVAEKLLVFMLPDLGEGLTEAELVSWLVAEGDTVAVDQAIAEVEDMALDALRYYDSIQPEDLRFVMIEGSDRILPELTLEMANYALDEMKKRGIE